MTDPYAKGYGFGLAFAQDAKPDNVESSPDWPEYVRLAKAVSEVANRTIANPSGSMSPQELAEYHRNDARLEALERKKPSFP